MSKPSRSAPSGAHLIEARIAPLRAALATHPVYAALHTVEDVRVFMQHHVFAVWDFMSLLKALQRALTSTDVPWRPVGSPTTRRFINAIVLEEESDEVDGEAFSHFEMYRRAMLEIGADPGPCDRVVAAAGSISSIVKAMEIQGVPPSVKAFVAAVLGGIGNIPGAVLGGLLMGVAETLVVWVDYSNYRDAIAFVILIAALLFRPGGLLGSAKVEKV